MEAVLTLLRDNLCVVVPVILILIIFIMMLTSSSGDNEGLRPWDTFDARFQQERDDHLGATPAGDSQREKSLRYKTEGLTGGYDPVEFNQGIGEELPPVPESDIDWTESSLQHSLHGV